MADSSHLRILRRLMVSSCMPIGDCGLVLDPTALWTGKKFGLRITEMLLSLSASCFFLLWLNEHHCLGLRPPAAMTDG